MARPMWSGTIQISLVGFGVEVYPAIQTARPITFHEVDRNTLGRVRRESVSAGPPAAEEPEVPQPREMPSGLSTQRRMALHLAPAIGEDTEPDMRPAEAPQQHAVERADIVKGYEYEQGKYAIIEPAELRNLRLAGKKTIEITQFSKSSEIDPALFEKPYFVMPKPGPQAAAFHVMRQSMAESEMVGVGEIVFSGRQHLMLLAPPHNRSQPGMMLYTLRFASELRDARDYANIGDVALADRAQLALAKQLIQAYTASFEVANFKDHYEEALRALVDAKLNHLPVSAPEEEKRPAKVVDLMDALRKSLAQRTPAAAEAGLDGRDETRPERKKPAGKAKSAGTSRKPKTA